MNYLGKGLESLIPGRKSPPPEAEPLDVLHGQKKLEEPIYHYHPESLKRPVPVPENQPRVRTAALRMPTRSIPQTPQPAGKTDSIFWIEINKIEPNPYQPRRDFDVGELTSLAASIRDHGILQPLLVTKTSLDKPGGMDVRYQLIAGERRWRAAKLAGLRAVPVIVRGSELAAQEKLELALIENVQREDLNAVERARAFQQLVDEFRLSHAEIGERIGKSREMVSNTLRLIRMPKDMIEALAANRISEGHARALLMLSDEPEKQRDLFREMQKGMMTVREAELAARGVGGEWFKKRSKIQSHRINADLRAMQSRLEEAFGTKVSLVKKGARGRIIVEFYSDEELDGILQRIAKER